VNIRQFKRIINMGLGSAILELRKNPGSNEKYKDAVLYACLHDTCLNAQDEPSRQRYLFEAIGLVGDKNYFEDRIIEKFNRADDLFLAIQLEELLFLFWKDGSKKSADALQKRLDVLISRLPHITRDTHRKSPREIAEHIATVLLDIQGIRSFFSTAEKFGSVLMRSKQEYVICYSGFLEDAKSKFGETRILRGLEKRSEKSKEIKRFLDEIHLEAEREKERKKNYETNRKSVLEWIDAVVEGERPFGYWGYWHTPRGAREMSAEELVKIASKIDNTDNPKVKRALLRVFRYVDYPYSVDKLLAIYNEGNDELKEVTLEALGRFKDRRIHDLAIYNLENGFYIYESLGLLGKNLKGEYELVLNVLKSHKNEKHDYHGIARGVRGIFSERRSPKAQEILLFDYHRNRCSNCRKDTVAIMCRSKCIPDDILEECLYDCCEETRKIAWRRSSATPLTLSG
jgi:hypothetical protein